MTDMALAYYKALAGELETENKRFRKYLEEIRDIAAVSDGVEFYAMLADKALTGDG